MPTGGASVIEFHVDCKDTKPGQAVYIAGEAFGNWLPKEAVPCMTTSKNFPHWTSGAVTIPKELNKIEFKLIIQREGGKGTRWEDGDNRRLTLEAAGANQNIRYTVHCNWGTKDVQVERKVIGGRMSVANPVSSTSLSLDRLKRPSVEPPEEKPQTEVKEAVSEADIETMKRWASRYLFENTDGTCDPEMSRLSSFVCFDVLDLENELSRVISEEELDELDKAAKREKLDKMQRKMESSSLLQEMKDITDYADPSHTVLLQGFNWESWKAGKGNWYGIVKSKVDMLAGMGITDIWLPPPSASVAEQGYLPSQLFNLNASKYGNEAQLKDLLDTMHKAGIRGVADIVINHRCGDEQDEQGRWNVFNAGLQSRSLSFAGVVDWQGWAITKGGKFSDGTGENAPAAFDQSFDAAPDIDHANERVQRGLSIWLRWLRLKVGFDAWRFDFVKGYAAKYVGLYCRKSEPAWAVGELWCDMKYDHDGLSHNQDQHRQDLVNWINATEKACTAFDFTTKGVLQEAVRNCQYWRLKDSKGKPPGLIGIMPSHAVTFIDNHDTGSTQNHWPFPADKVLVGYAYTLTHPGIPSIFWDHVMDWGDKHRQTIAELLKVRKEAGIGADSTVKILTADADLYIAEVGGTVRVALGPRDPGGVDGNYWASGPRGDCFRVWYHKK
mmetsp:Transcript_59016/g.140933  ORF Transcript_59016/g.140933 Transcript_59016/m.140933 type:complete len:668 (-) Transcript_59016:172-2175(-)|eukprot:CAMPEP_0178424126 /NCGR_PEP_ID=MMETSP0689_2-20121128/28049_1 /TAXON_ID=160604 /ORGANISM="Amphidinium massartii, Strain CS-259" /LENGTH=667 /DNA_ID=CAMNT_0020045753 /DNA_START=38 /DNA_END=2041 /DNA_ORIENTATION=+